MAVMQHANQVNCVYVMDVPFIYPNLGNPNVERAKPGYQGRKITKLVKRELRWGRVHVHTPGKTAGIMCHTGR